MKKGFTLGDVIFDRVVMVTAEDSAGNILYTLTQISESNINVTAETKEKKDAQGTVVRTFYMGKNGEANFTNAFFNTNVNAASSGVDKETASASNMIKAPCIKEIEVGTATVELTGLIDGTLSVIGIDSTGDVVTTFTKDTAAGADTYAVASEVLTLPTSYTEDRIATIVVKYERNSQNVVKITNRSDKFPKAVKLTVKALAVDPCSQDNFRACYIVIPSFQVSPECDLNLSTEGTIEYKGKLQSNYCSKNKELYILYFLEDED